MNKESIIYMCQGINILQYKVKFDFKLNFTPDYDDSYLF